jgi:hypothetical protein
MKEVLRIVIKILWWIDDHINHAIIEELLEIPSQENVVVVFLQDRCAGFCQWVGMVDYKYFSDEWKWEESKPEQD